MLCIKPCNKALLVEQGYCQGNDTCAMKAKPNPPEGKKPAPWEGAGVGKSQPQVAPNVSCRREDMPSGAVWRELPAGTLQESLMLLKQNTPGEGLKKQPDSFQTLFSQQR